MFLHAITLIFNSFFLCKTNVFCRCAASSSHWASWHYVRYVSWDHRRPSGLVDLTFQAIKSLPHALLRNAHNSARTRKKKKLDAGKTVCADISGLCWWWKLSCAYCKPEWNTDEKYTFGYFPLQCSASWALCECSRTQTNVLKGK